jgi:hypothetical protein
LNLVREFLAAVRVLKITADVILRSLPDSSSLPGADRKDAVQGELRTSANAVRDSSRLLTG